MSDGSTLGTLHDGDIDGIIGISRGVIWYWGQQPPSFAAIRPRYKCAAESQGQGGVGFFVDFLANDAQARRVQMLAQLVCSRLRERIALVGILSVNEKART